MKGEKEVSRLRLSISKIELSIEQLVTQYRSKKKSLDEASRNLATWRTEYNELQKQAPGSAPSAVPIKPEGLDWLQHLFPGTVLDDADSQIWDGMVVLLDIA